MEVDKLIAKKSEVEEIRNCSKNNGIESKRCNKKGIEYLETVLIALTKDGIHMISSSS